MFSQFQETLTFDDVLLVPQHSRVLPKDPILESHVTNRITVNMPFLSAPMDTVTEHSMAIALALAGGMGFIHKNLPIEEQVKEVELVKRFKNGFIEDPVTVRPEDTIAKVIEIRKEYGYKKVPVVNERGVLIGMISDVDYFPVEDKNLMIKFRMVAVKELVVAKRGIRLEKANEMIRELRLESLCVVDKAGRLVSLVTRRDIEKNEQFPYACKDDDKQLRVGAAVGVGKTAIERAGALFEAGVDVIVVDTAHGHSEGVMATVKALRKKFRDSNLIAGNIATAEAAEALVSAGVDAVKVGIGPGSICTTRVVAGVGVPQLSALLDVQKGIRKSKRKVPMIADGGITSSGDIVKALAIGASTVMMGNIFAGTDESQGKVEFLDGHMYKVYRGMGSLEAMEFGSKDRYGQGHIDEKKKFVPEGVSGRVRYKGPVDRIIYQLAGGLRSGMGYCGARTILELQKNARFVRMTHAGLKESHPHDLGPVENAPNYATDRYQ